MSCNDMVSFQYDQFEAGVASRLCVDPYEPIPIINTPVQNTSATSSPSIVLPIILTILVIVFCLGCIIGIPVIAYIVKQKGNDKDFTDINKAANAENDSDDPQNNIGQVNSN